MYNSSTMATKDIYVAYANTHKHKLLPPTCREAEERIEFIVTHGTPDTKQAAILDITTGSPLGQWIQMPLVFNRSLELDTDNSILELLPQPPNKNYASYPVFFKRPGVLLGTRHQYSDENHEKLGITNGIALLEDGNLWLVTVHGDITRLWIDSNTENTVRERIMSVLPEHLTTLPHGTPGGRRI
jgi:hypothetical protein